MFSKIGKVIFGSSNDRQLNKLRPTVNRINELENEISKLNDSELIKNTESFKNRIRNGETIDSILPYEKCDVFWRSKYAFIYMG